VSQFAEFCEFSKNRTYDDYLISIFRHILGQTLPQNAHSANRPVRVSRAFEIIFRIAQPSSPSTELFVLHLEPKIDLF